MINKTLDSKQTQNRVIIFLIGHSEKSQLDKSKIIFKLAKIELHSELQIKNYMKLF